MEMGLTQVELGKRAGGIKSGVMSRYESDGVESPKTAHLLAIAAALDANPQYILNGTLPKRLSKLGGSVQELTDIASTLDASALAMLVAAAKALQK